MTCYKPLQGYQSLSTNLNGKRPVFFKPSANTPVAISIGCGQCIGCRLERSRQWAIRCMHEASLYDNNCFITLTFDDKHLPIDNSIHVRDLQLFMKRLRKRYPATSIRFYACGEYGDLFGRPHYHIILFNHQFDDRVLWKKTNNGEILFRSDSLETLWPFGYSSIGNVTFESAAYVARYILKKINGDQSKKHYTTIDPETGEIKIRNPEFTVMSRMPGIATAWFEKYKDEVYPSDEIIIKGKKMLPPKFYDNRYELTDPAAFAVMKQTRKDNAIAADKKNPMEKSESRLLVKRKIKEAQAAKLLRTLK